MSYKSIDDTAAQSYKQLSRALVKRVDDNSRAAYEERGKGAGQAYDYDHRPELSVSVPINGLTQIGWMVVPYLWIPSRRCIEITMRAYGAVLDGDVELGYHVRPLSRLKDPLRVPEASSIVTVSPGNQDAVWPIDISELNTGDPLVFFLFIKGQVFDVNRVEKAAAPGVSAFDLGWRESFVPFSINASTGWFSNSPHQVVGFGWDDGVGKVQLPDSGYFPFSRRVIRREYLGGTNFAYVWPPFDDRVDVGDDQLDPPNDEAFLEDYSHIKLSSVSFRETKFAPLNSAGSSLNNGQTPHVGPHKEIYRTAERVYQRGRVHTLGPVMNRNFSDGGFTTPAGFYPVRRSSYIATPTPGGSTTIANAIARYDDWFYENGEGLRKRRADIEVLALIACTYVNTGFDGPEERSVSFDFTVESRNRDGANLYTTDPVTASIPLTPLARGHDGLVESSNLGGYLLGNFRTAGWYNGQALDTIVAHGLQDGLPPDVVPLINWSVVRLRVQDPLAGGTVRLLKLKAGLTPYTLPPRTDRMLWHCYGLYVADTQLDVALNGAGI